MECSFFCALGVAIGVIITRYFLHKKSTYGVVYINEDDPEYATCGISFNSSIDDIKTHKYLVLDVMPARDNQSR